MTEAFLMVVLITYIGFLPWRLTLTTYIRVSPWRLKCATKTLKWIKGGQTPTSIMSLRQLSILSLNSHSLGMQEDAPTTRWRVTPKDGAPIRVKSLRQLSTPHPNCSPSYTLAVLHESQGNLLTSQWRIMPEDGISSLPSSLEDSDNEKVEGVL